MGINYSINLYYESHQVENALLGLIKIAYISEKKATVVELPSGNYITVPFTSNFKTLPIKLFLNHLNAELDTTLTFPIDEKVENYLNQSYHDRVANMACIGYIYLKICIGHRYSQFSFTAAVSDMSRLFLNSTAVHNRFLELMKATGGMFGLLDIEKDYYLYLADPNQRIEGCDGDLSHDESSDIFYFDVDEFTECCLRKITNITVTSISR